MTRSSGTALRRVTGSRRATRVVVVGAGAAGTLTAAQLARAATTSGRVDVTLVGDDPATGRGVAYRTPDRRHLLNVPSTGMSAHPADPGHFDRWLRATGAVSPAESIEHQRAVFAPRAVYGDYLEDVLREAVSGSAGRATLRRVVGRAVAIEPPTSRNEASVRLAGGDALPAAAIVLALGTFPPGVAWAPAALRRSPRFVADPWAPGALATRTDDRSVLLVGTGLTMVDVALSLDRPGRSMLAVSRGGELPKAHALRPRPVVPLDEPLAGRPLADVRAIVGRHVRDCVGRYGDWRPAIDGLRAVTNDIWRGWSAADQAAFLVSGLSGWSRHRHRMAPAVAAALTACRAAGRLAIRADEVLDAIELSDGRLLVRFRDGAERVVDLVVNCTGPASDLRLVGDPLLDQLLARGLAVPGPHAIGLDVDPDGRIVDGSGVALPWLWTLGCTRRGHLIESTAVPEIREQAASIAEAVAAGGAPRHRVRRPRDQYGLPLSTTRAAAAHYVDALDRVLRVQSGAEDALREAVAIDPGFAIGHATLALLGHEWGAPVDVAASLLAATTAARARADERERSLVRVVSDLVSRRCPAEDAGVVRHIASYPRDALAVSVAVPTIAFSGLAGPPQRTWELVEGLAPSYGDDWWYAGLLAFIRQEQERWDDAAALADRALAEVPSSGHAVHARAHVYYETGQHADGLGWLDPWVTSCGRSASHRAHFSWHAALHELALGDLDAVRARYVRELSPPAVSGMRALVDSASLLWRCKVWGAWRSELPMDEVLDAVPDTLLDRPPTPFAAFHAGLALAAAGDVAGLTKLASRATSSDDPTQRDVVAPLVIALRALVEGRPGEAADDLLRLRGRLRPVGGSAAQREVVEDTLLAALVDAGRYADARAILAHRLDRRPSRLDREQLARLSAAAR